MHVDNTFARQGFINEATDFRKALGQPRGLELQTEREKRGVNEQGVCGLGVCFMGIPRFLVGFLNFLNAVGKLLRDLRDLSCFQGF